MGNSTSVDLRRGERGAVSIKTLLIFTFLGSAVFVLVKVLPVYVEQRQVIHEVDELARAAVIRGYKPEKIYQDIGKLLKNFDLPESSVNYEPNNTGVRIIVGYQRDINFLVTTYTWRVDHTAVGKDL